MSAITDPAGGALLQSRRGARGRKLRNHAATGLIVASVVIALIPLVAVIGFVISRGGPVFGWHFLTQDIPLVDRDIGGGMLPAIVGTLIITGRQRHSGRRQKSRPGFPHTRVTTPTVTGPVTITRFHPQWVGSQAASDTS